MNADIYSLLDHEQHELIDLLRNEYLSNGYSWTWVEQGTDAPVLAGGFIPIVAGVVEVWAIVSPKRFSYTTLKFLLEALYEWHIEVARRYDIMRYQCLVDQAHPGAERLVQHLGYIHEGTLTEWGKDRAVKYRYAWLAKLHSAPGSRST